MSSEFQGRRNFGVIIRHYPVVTYFALTFTISWMGALAVAAPHVIRQQPLPKMTGILMFPVMLLGPSFTGIVLTRMLTEKTAYGTCSPECFWYGFPRVVHRASHSSSPSPYCSPLLARILVPGLHSQPLYPRHPVRYSSRFARRNRLDGLCISENASPKQWTVRRNRSRAVVGHVALARY